MSTGKTATQIEVRIAGKTLFLPSVEICGRTVLVKGSWLRIAVVKDEELVEGEVIADPTAFLDELSQSPLRADILSFEQKLPDVAVKYSYHVQWENAAIVPITNYEDWLKNRVEYDVRKAVKKAARLGVVVKTVEFDDAFVQGIMGIYNDNPIRQGKAFWHYQKDFETVKRENATYLERSEFIGAYYQDELIGFIKMVYVDRIARTLQVISKTTHYDKRATNALLAKAIEICEQKGLTHLVYGNFVYNDENSSLSQFKQRNGFEKIMIPRYLIPLTLKGRLALKLGLQRGVKGVIPNWALKLGLRARAGVAKRMLRRSSAKA
jgi:hypothetical protein